MGIDNQRFTTNKVGVCKNVKILREVCVCAQARIVYGMMLYFTLLHNIYIILMYYIVYT